MNRKLEVAIFCLLILFPITTFGQQSDFSSNELRGTVTSTGIGLGTAIAVAASWSKNKSIRWAIVHGILGWLYVIYYAINREG